MSTTVTVRDHNDVRHSILIPDGWFPVQVHEWGWGPHGAPQIGDRFLDINYLSVNFGQSWRTIETQAEIDLVEPRVYGCLIRKKPGPEIFQGANI